MSLVQCPGCNHEIYPVKQPTQSGGKKLSCPKCHCALPATILDAAEATVTNVGARHAPTAAAPIQPGSAAHIIAVAAAALDPEAQIRARLDWIDARLAEVEPLREEQAKLRRMLDAAAPPSAKRATA